VELETEIWKKNALTRQNPTTGASTAELFPDRQWRVWAFVEDRIRCGLRHRHAFQQQEPWNWSEWPPEIWPGEANRVDNKVSTAVGPPTKKSMLVTPLNKLCHFELFSNNLNHHQGLWIKCSVCFDPFPWVLRRLAIHSRWGSFLILLPTQWNPRTSARWG